MVTRGVLSIAQMKTFMLFLPWKRKKELKKELKNEQILLVGTASRKVQLIKVSGLDLEQSRAFAQGFTHGVFRIPRASSGGLRHFIHGKILLESIPNETVQFSAF